MLAKHGHRARIDLKEARMLAAEQGTTTCNNIRMVTNPIPDDRRVKEIGLSGGRKTKKEAARAENANHCREPRILKAFRTVNFDPNYDYKAERRRKRS
jgi:hypothetical protein